MYSTCTYFCMYWSMTGSLSQSRIRSPACACKQANRSCTSCACLAHCRNSSPRLPTPSRNKPPLTITSSRPSSLAHPVVYHAPQVPLPPTLPHHSVIPMLPSVTLHAAASAIPDVATVTRHGAPHHQDAASLFDTPRGAPCRVTVPLPPTLPHHSSPPTLSHTTLQSAASATAVDVTTDRHGAPFTMNARTMSEPPKGDHTPTTLHLPSPTPPPNPPKRPSKPPTNPYKKPTPETTTPKPPPIPSPTDIAAAIIIAAPTHIPNPASAPAPAPPHLVDNVNDVIAAPNHIRHPSSAPAPFPPHLTHTSTDDDSVDDPSNVTDPFPPPVPTPPHAGDIPAPPPSPSLHPRCRR